MSTVRVPTPTLAGIKPDPGDDFEVALLHDG